MSRTKKCLRTNINILSLSNSWGEISTKVKLLCKFECKRIKVRNQIYLLLVIKSLMK